MRSPATYLRAWMKTKDLCGEEFKDVRTDIERTVTPVVMKQINAFAETERDVWIASQAVTHYRDWHRQELLRYLPLYERVVSRTIMKVERTLRA